MKVEIDEKELQLILDALDMYSDIGQDTMTEIFQSYDEEMQKKGFFYFMRLEFLIVKLQMLQGVSEEK